MRMHLGGLLGVIALCLASELQGAAVTVINTNDNLAGSLRQAIQDANAGDSIVFNIPTSDPGFDPNTKATTITLTSGPLVINKDLTIRGTDARIIIQRSSAQGTSRPSTND